MTIRKKTELIDRLIAGYPETHVVWNQTTSGGSYNLLDDKGGIGIPVTQSVVKLVEADGFVKRTKNQWNRKEFKVSRPVSEEEKKAAAERLSLIGKDRLSWDAPIPQSPPLSKERQEMEEIEECLSKGARIWSLSLDKDWKIERAPQADGSELWALRSAFGFCINKEGEDDYEPSPSNRDNEFLANYRFATTTEAFDAWERYQDKQKAIIEEISKSKRAP